MERRWPIVGGFNAGVAFVIGSAYTYFGLGTSPNEAGAASISLPPHVG
jgi:hypothetical protein